MRLCVALLILTLSSATGTFLRSSFACIDDELLRAEPEYRNNDPGLTRNAPAFKKVVRRTTSVSCSFDSKMEPSLETLQSRLSLSQPEMKKVVQKFPGVLRLSFKTKIEPSLAVLQSRLSLSDPELKKLVLRTPSVLGSSYEAAIEPRLVSLQSRLSLSDAELKVVLGLPQLLGL